MLKRLKIQPIGNPDQDLGDDPDAYRTTFCTKDMDSVQLTACRKCEFCHGILTDVKCSWEKTNGQ